MQRGSWRRHERGLTDEWRPTYHGVQLALAEAYAARFAGEPAVAQFRAATVLAEPFGAYFALEPRLNLATSCSPTAAATRAASSSSSAGAPPTTWVHDDLERRAIRLATRTRVPLPAVGSDARDR